MGVATNESNSNNNNANISPFHAKYYAWELTRRRRGGDIDRISQSLFDAAVDLNPHQIDAAVFALQNPLSKGVLLADEVGLGKTIEAALVLGQFWAERRRKLLVLCPASIRKQWALELGEKFNLPAQILDSITWKRLRKEGVHDPLGRECITIMSISFAARMEPALRAIPWDLVVIDEAHKLRNAHRDSHRTGQAIKRALAGVRKLLVTATPLQNSLIELYGLSTVIDEHLFGDRISFRSQFMRGDDSIPALRARLGEFVYRTLRRQVLEYVQYTERKPVTFPFNPSDEEQRLYDLVSGYLQRGDGYGIPHQQRHLVGIILRKLLASSTEAVIATLEVILGRLRQLETKGSVEDDWLERFINEEELDEELIDEAEEGAGDAVTATEEPALDLVKLRGEIAELEQYIHVARGIREDAKSHALLTALETGFGRMAESGSARKAVIFTESLRTQDYLARFLETHGYAGKVITFSGKSASAAITGIYQRWLDANKGSDRVTGSGAIDRRTALIDHFRDSAEIMISTEAGAEGVNLQFCSLVVNYDLPWNPQRVEQRIGRCHRYGQKHDVVVINFLNQRNLADRRVLELLSDKFHLFEGVFGASDDILGRIESGVDIERRISEIYDTCRTTEEIEAAFAKLRQEMESSIDQRMRETEAKLIENFDEQILERLRVRREDAEAQLDRIARIFWQLTRHVLVEHAKFNSPKLSFVLQRSPCANAPVGDYQLIQKGRTAPEHAHVYRLTHPLGEYVLDSGRGLELPEAVLEFALSKHAQKISVLEGLGIKEGWLELNLLELESFQLEEHLVFSAQADDGTLLDHEACERLFNVPAKVQPAAIGAPPEGFAANVRRQIEATLSRALEENNEYFQRERDKLDHWADDQIKAAELELEDTKIKIRDTKRQARLALTVEDQLNLQNKIKELESVQRRQRQRIWDVEDEINAKRDTLIDALQKRINQHSRTHRLFRIRWKIN
jgi:superfamily II DNA or RNA helicase